MLSPHASDSELSAQALRFMAAVHRLVLEGKAPALAPFYPSVGGDLPPEEAWPAFDPALAAEEMVELPIQVNGKLRDRVVVSVGLSQVEIEEIVLGREKVVAVLADRTPKRVIHVPGRLVNLVV